jgi:hydroxypyruvate isomerase
MALPAGGRGADRRNVLDKTMLRFTANLSFLFTDRPLTERFAAARAAGFEGVECPNPYDYPEDVLQRAIAAAGIRLTGINTPSGDRAQGEWGFAGVPGQEQRFARDFDLALRYATALGASMMHVTAGTLPPEARALGLTVYKSNIRRAAEKAAAEAAGLTLLLEPINSRDAPGYLVPHCDELAGIIAEIGAPNVKLLFDVYHVQIMDGDVIRRLQRHRHIIGHVQVAGVPSRAEPDSGNELNFPAIFEALRAIGYRGWIGAEYRPRAGAGDGLGWLRDARRETRPA